MPLLNPLNEGVCALAGCAARNKTEAAASARPNALLRVGALGLIRRAFGFAPSFTAALLASGLTRTGGARIAAILICRERLGPRTEADRHCDLDRLAAGDHDRRTRKITAAR